MLDLRTLEVIVWISRLGGFRAAAQKLNTAQPALTARVKALEAELGAALLVRGPRGAMLTAKGRALVAYAERMLALREEAIAAVAGPGALRGTVRLGVSETIVHTWLPAFIERMAAEYPALSLEIEVDVTPALRAGLLDHSLDAAFLLGPLAEPRTASLPLSRYPMGWLARPGLVAEGAVLDRAALRRFAMVTYARATRPWRDVHGALTSPGEAPPRIFANASVSTILRMARDGIGIAAIPPVLAEDELAAGRLVRLAAEVTLPSLVFTASWAETPDSHLARAVVRLAAEVAAAQPYAAGDHEP